MRDGYDIPASHRCLPEPGALAARLHRPRDLDRRGSPDPAARAGQVPRDLGPDPRSLLPGARRRAQDPDRSPGLRALARRTRAPRAARGRAPARDRADAATGRPARQGSAAEARGGGHRHPHLGRARPGDHASRALAPLRRADLRGPDPPRRRPGPSLPVHLESLPQPGADGLRARHRDPPLRPREGAAALAALPAVRGARPPRSRSSR